MSYDPACVVIVSGGRAVYVLADHSHWLPGRLASVLDAAEADWSDAGRLAAALVAATGAWGVWVSPPDSDMGNEWLVLDLDRQEVRVVAALEPPLSGPALMAVTIRQWATVMLDATFDTVRLMTETGSPGHRPGLGTPEPADVWRAGAGW